MVVIEQMPVETSQPIGWVFATTPRICTTTFNRRYSKNLNILNSSHLRIWCMHMGWKFIKLEELSDQIKWDDAKHDRTLWKQILFLVAVLECGFFFFDTWHFVFVRAHTKQQQQQHLNRKFASIILFHLRKFESNNNGKMWEQTWAHTRLMYLFACVCVYLYFSPF